MIINDRQVLTVLGIMLAVVAFVGYISYAAPKAQAGITQSNPITRDPGRVITHVFFSATTTTAVSTNDSRVPSNQMLDIKGVKKVTMSFTHGGTATTSTAGARFSVQVSQDGSAWLDFNKLVGADLSSTATSTYTIQGATSTVPVSLVLTHDVYRFLRCTATEVGTEGTQGEHTCSATAEY